jgi:exodeoxyribonuclease V beta subunit
LGRDNPYGRADMAAAMAHHHYPLQAALYLVALHRMLRWRLPSYEPRVHLGGAAYLFVRGMVPAAGTATDDARGVFWWQPPSAAVEALDRLLAGESSDA